ncbi:MAG: hypothetical protein ACRDPY_48340 [Streptosporangiaceae bacterium]
MRRDRPARDHTREEPSRSWAAPGKLRARPGLFGEVPEESGQARGKQYGMTPGLAATLRHAASMHNPEFYERQRMRASTYNIPRFLHCYQETIDGGLILPRGRQRGPVRPRRLGLQRPRAVVAGTTGVVAGPRALPRPWQQASRSAVDDSRSIHAYRSVM